MLATKKTELLRLRFKSQKHPFHILPGSPFPLLTGLSLFAMLVPLTQYLHSTDANTPLWLCTLTCFVALCVVAISWFASILVESAAGDHTKAVQTGLRLGMLLFILSEVMLFFAFFWAFFHYSLVPSIAVGNIWPPTDTQELATWGLPLLNTLLLLQSGFMITKAHSALVAEKTEIVTMGLLLTILFGATFLYCQAEEYTHGVVFSFHGDLFGSIFFLTTGFHGLHVTIGTLFLLICAVRHILTTLDRKGLRALPKRQEYKSVNVYSFQSWQHFGFEAAAWYWHFVDVVWLFLFITIYWWGAA